MKEEIPPGFFLYIDDLTSDGKVEAMTTEEFGAYMLLLCKAWREKPPGSIPDDDYVLARWTRLTPERWTECRARVLAAFYAGRDKRWYQKRMRKEFEKMRTSRTKRVQAATKAATDRWKAENALRMRHALQPQSERTADSCLSSSTPSSTSSSKETLKFSSETNTGREREIVVSRTQRPPSDLQIVFEHWNAQPNITHHRTIAGQERYIKTALAAFSLEEIKTAISRYSVVRSGNGNFREIYSWTIGEFLSREGHKNIVRFNAPSWKEDFKPFDKAGGGFEDCDEHNRRSAEAALRMMQNDRLRNK